MMLSVSSGFAREKLGLEGVFFFPVDFLVTPSIMAAVVLTHPWSKRFSETTANATLWYNAAYMVGLSVAVLWAMQLAALFYHFRYWHQFDFSAFAFRNSALLFWAAVSIGICRAVLSQSIQAKRTLFGGERS